MVPNKITNPLSI